MEREASQAVNIRKCDFDREDGQASEHTAQWPSTEEILQDGSRGAGGAGDLCSQMVELH